MEVGPGVPLDPGDWPYGTLHSSETLWKYMDLWKLEDMLAKSALYFSRQDRLSDPFEGRFSVGNSTEFSPSDKAFYDSHSVNRSLAEAKEQHETLRHCVFISCWHRNTKEAREMWDAYTSCPDSVVVTTSAKAVYRFISSEIMKSPVKYHGDDFPRSEIFGWNTLSFYKPSTYNFEREFRMLRVLGKDESVLWNEPADYGRYVQVRLKRIIHRVITHPRGSGALKRKLETLLRQYLKAIHRENSSLE